MPDSEEQHRIGSGAIRIDLPDTIQQTDYSCGAACLQAVCRYYGVGKDDEWEFVEDLKMDRRIGSHPFQLVRAAKKYGLEVIEYYPMSRAELRRCLSQRKPVLLMIQAWAHDAGGKKRRSYKTTWVDGHWVVAIGYDRSGVFFEDPSLEAARGFLTFEELDERWHDVGPRGRRMSHYGLVLWRARPTPSGYARSARRIP